MIVKPVASNRLAHWVHRALLSGLILSACLLVVGLTIALARQEPRPRAIPEAGFLLLRHALHGEGVAVVNLGLLILMLTPALRLMVLSIGWFRDGDHVFASVAAVVLALLAVSILLGMS